MGKDLYEYSAVARRYYDQAEEALKFPLKDYCFNGPEEKLTDTSVCQPALYVHGFVLWAIIVEELKSFPFFAAAGLSLGEYTAHAVAGTFDFQTGLRLVHERGRLMQEATAKTKGGMVSLIGATNEEAMEIAKEAGLDAANFNCPGQVVLSGQAELISKAVEIAKAKGVKKAIPLKVAGAYHSRLMKSAQEGLKPFLLEAKINESHARVVANVTAGLVHSPDEVRDTLGAQVTGSVRWEESIRFLLAQGVEEFIELGPGAVLAGLLKRIEGNAPCVSIATVEDWNKNKELLQ
jgi:[acyl-carrier-protein] S-malonyltransferase